MASLSATGDDNSSGLKCSCGRWRSPRILQRVFLVTGLPWASVFVFRTIFTGNSLAPFGTSDAGMYVMVPRFSSESNSLFHEVAHCCASGASLASASVLGELKHSGVLWVIALACFAWCAVGVVVTVAVGSVLGL